MSRTRPTPGACICRSTTTSCCSCTAATCSRKPEMADERNYYKPQAGSHGAHDSGAARNWSAGMAVFDISKPAEPRQIGFMPVEGTGLHRIWYVGGRWAYASAMIDGFSDYILITIDMQDPTKPRDRRPLLAAGHESRGRRDGELAAGARALRPAPRGRRRRHRLLRLARRLSGERRCFRQDQPEADRPRELVAAVRRRHPQLPAAARPRPADRARRGGARRDGRRLQADLGVRQPGQIEPDQHRDVPAARATATMSRSAAISGRTTSTRTGPAASRARP